MGLWERIAKYIDKEIMEGNKMRIIIMIVSLLFITIPLLASDKNLQNHAPVFTDQDLEKYRYPSDLRESDVDLKPQGDKTGSRDVKTIDRELLRPEKSMSPQENKKRPYSEIRAILYKTST